MALMQRLEWVRGGRRLLHRWLCHRLCRHRSVEVRHDRTALEQTAPAPLRPDSATPSPVLTSNLLAEIRISVLFRSLPGDGRSERTRCLGQFSTHEADAITTLIRQHGSTVRLYAAPRDVAAQPDLPLLLGLLTGTGAMPFVPRRQ